MSALGLRGGQILISETFDYSCPIAYTQTLPYNPGICSWWPWREWPISHKTRHVRTEFPRLDAWASISRLRVACLASKRAEVSFWRRRLNWTEVPEGVRIFFLSATRTTFTRLDFTVFCHLNLQNWLKNWSSIFRENKAACNSTETNALQLRLHSPARNLIL